MATLARWCVRHRRIVLASWLVGLVVFLGIEASVGSTYSNNFSLPHTDSNTAANILQTSFPSQSGDNEQIVVHARSGTLRDPATERQVGAMLAKVRTVPSVQETTSPYSSPALISKDGTIGLATVHLAELPQNVPTSVSDQLVRTAQSFQTPALQVELGGPAVNAAQNSGGQGTSEGLGILFALLVLFFAFRRSLLSAVLPLISALVAIGIGTSIIAALTHAIAIPQFGPILAVLVALGVGVDYALFIVTRHRNGLLAGRSPEEAAVVALNTSGRAVFFAGLTVCIALLGMFALQLDFLYGVAISAALVVALTMAASLTLLPALLGFFGTRVLRRSERRRLAADGLVVERPDSLWRRWAAFLEGRSAVLSAVAFGLIVVLALPFFGMRLGLTDAGSDPPSSTTRQAYDLLAKGFGPGFNGPFTLVAETGGPGDAARFEGLLHTLARTPGVAAVGPARANAARTAEVAFLYPQAAPQAEASTTLLHHIRQDVIPPAEAGSSLQVHVGGFTAGGEDFSHVLSSKLPQFVGVVVLLSFLLLAAVFRSLLVPLTASVMNLLSIGAALGVMTAVFQYGWARQLVGLTRNGPIDVYVPVLLFAVLFGLSMDYEVFLVSRMHEEWSASGDNARAVTRGQAETGRVITAAALIMIFVFLSFVFGGQRAIKEFGVSFAAAVFLDAFVIRTVLVPSLMHLFGRANWWLPARIDRILPRLHVEGRDIPENPTPEAPAEVSA